jgi:hypothetical protein
LLTVKANGWRYDYEEMEYLGIAAGILGLLLVGNSPIPEKTIRKKAMNQKFNILMKLIFNNNRKNSKIYQLKKSLVN